MQREHAEGKYVIRAATIADAAAIAHHRVAMFRDMGILPEGEATELLAASHAYLMTALPSGQYLGWVVEARGRIVAGGGALLRRLLPRPGHVHGSEEAYLLNVYTDPQHRRRGLARQLMQLILAWCDTRGITRITLHASNAGRLVYQGLGFVDTNEMRLVLR